MEAGELQLSLENVTEVGGNSRLWSTESKAVHLKKRQKDINCTPTAKI